MDHQHVRQWNVEQISILPHLAQPRTILAPGHHRCMTCSYSTSIIRDSQTGCHWKGSGVRQYATASSLDRARQRDSIVQTRCLRYSSLAWPRNPPSRSDQRSHQIFLPRDRYLIGRACPLPRQAISLNDNRGAWRLSSKLRIVIHAVWQLETRGRSIASTVEFISSLDVQLADGSWDSALCPLFNECIFVRYVKILIWQKHAFCYKG